jgi:hypothetical protein
MNTYLTRNYNDYLFIYIYIYIYNPTVEEIWKTIHHLKLYFRNKENEIGLSMVANLQINCEKQKKCTQKKITDFFNCT